MGPVPFTKETRGFRVLAYNVKGLGLHPQHKKRRFICHSVLEMAASEKQAVTTDASPGSTS